jgi:hypothetical protein
LFGVERSRTLAGDAASRAKQAIQAAGLSDGWLAAIAEWVVSRRN